MYRVIDVSQKTEYAEEIYRIEKECFPDEFWSFELIQNDIKNPGSIYILCYDDNKTVGYANVSTVLDEAELNRIAVKHSYRRNGAARLIIGQLVRLLKEAGYTKLMLEVRSQNIGAVSLYSSCGFSADGIRKNYYQNPCDDAILMSLNI